MNTSRIPTGFSTGSTPLLERRRTVSTNVYAPFYAFYAFYAIKYILYTHTPDIKDFPAHAHDETNRFFCRRRRRKRRTPLFY
jgi:hypothetical protein